jgi:nucleoside phosphorylase
MEHLPSASFYSEGDPHVDPERLVQHICERRGITRDQLGVRPAVLGTFNSRLTRYIATQSGAQPAEHWIRQYEAAFGEGPAYIDGDSVSIVTLPIGAPAAVTLMEEMIACGTKALIVTGAAGSLQPHAPIGSLVVPDAAIREEGTSHHYTPSHEPATPSPRLRPLSRRRSAIAAFRTPPARRGRPTLRTASTAARSTAIARLVS